MGTDHPYRVGGSLLHELAVADRRDVRGAYGGRFRLSHRRNAARMYHRVHHIHDGRVRDSRTAVDVGLCPKSRGAVSRRTQRPAQDSTRAVAYYMGRLGSESYRAHGGADLHNRNNNIGTRRIMLHRPRQDPASSFHGRGAFAAPAVCRPALCRSHLSVRS